ncbi:Cys-tRNA(Pro) deacylase [Dolosicoccus paucivorans]|uniref:Cys-tRNA(Pro)/Cys-tRNA(Cys) deacylase n=1 Tax=Dolosicoccus paucivorans TaxID=84521 RepID=A0A2N6SMK5_9LACT|nr:Cys-tRNA(Pro) deacylase [Dolosicoccus paucivorans]PMB84006.1 Cys-tRNA(Pro) deacylase [Dolosicoccus paucivorans]PMC58290.1 Cys-tRNA(Pro) deacylase [Dolosicoccus paucivorans]
MEKTNVMRQLDQKKISYEVFIDEEKGDHIKSGVEMAESVGVDASKTYKTLVTEGKSKEHYVFMIPVAQTLNLKKAAKVVGEKNIHMILAKDLEPLTGYVHGGCSPIGMKKRFKTWIHQTAKDQDQIHFSAGKRGYQVAMTLSDLQKMIPVKLADLTDEV